MIGDIIEWFKRKDENVLDSEAVKALQSTFKKAMEEAPSTIVYYDGRVEYELPNGKRIKSVEIVGLREVGTHEKFLFEESRVIDRSDSSSSSREIIEFTKEWSKKVGAEYERLNVNGYVSSIGSSIESSMGVEAAVKSELKSSISSSIEISSVESIREKYSIVEGMVYRTTEKTEIDIPPHTKTKFTIQWKNIWIDGILEVLAAKIVNNEVRQYEVELPFSVLMNVTFDRKQVDL